jgi:hypothetical protein
VSHDESTVVMTTWIWDGSRGIIVVARSDRPAARGGSSREHRVFANAGVDAFGSCARRSGALK